ncbi:DDE Tnp4 domain-containing protein [Aphis craccivora]|uniref:DDE Tnp4 domain-containing protein n=1 Tax=Aphis craccivora TaxID=307492 RepID=A0A6G0VTU0_APHCR|nr:DDE Tnp4 domain-containing protein [Aphis craccivora]
MKLDGLANEVNSDTDASGSLKEQFISVSVSLVFSSYTSSVASLKLFGESSFSTCVRGKFPELSLGIITSFKNIMQLNYHFDPWV